MNRFLIFILALFSCSAFADTITTEIIVTNTPATGYNLTYFGGFRYWTNARTATTFDTNGVTDINYAATNLYSQFALNAPTDATYGRVRVSRGATNSIKLLAPVGLIPTMSQNSNWIRWVFTTNLTQPATNISVPAAKAWPIVTDRTNIIGQLQNDIVDYGAAGKGYPTNDARLTNYVGTGNYPQTALGALTLNQIAGGTNKGTLFGGTNRDGSLTNVALQSIISDWKGHIDWVFDQTNAPNGGPRFYNLATNIFTTLTWNGEDPEIYYLYGTNAAGTITIGTPVDVSPFAFYGSGLLLNVYSAFRMFPIMNGDSVPMLGYQPTNTWKSVNVWSNPLNTFIGLVTMSNGVNISGGASSNMFNQSMISSNSTFAGTNIIAGSVRYPRSANTTLVNGNNPGILLGTNVYITLTGPTTVSELAGFVAQPDGTYHIVQLRGAITNWVVNYTGSSRGTDGTAANRIETGNPAGGSPAIDISMTNNPSWMEIIYDGSVSRWQVLSHSN